MAGPRLTHYVQRQIGLGLAEAENATRTSRVIKDPDACYDDIFAAAVEEIGIDRLVARVLDNGPEWAYRVLLHVSDLGSHRSALIAKAAESPEWAFNTLRSVPDLGRHRDKLMATAAKSPEWALQTLRFVPDLGSSQHMLETKVGPLAQSFGNISGFNLLDQAWYNCSFTMKWVHNGVTYPTDVGGATYSPELSGGGGPTQEPCTYFPKENEPLQAGDAVWMYMYVRAGNDVESAFRFTYDPSTENYAYFTATGSTSSPTLALVGVEPYNPNLPHGQSAVPA
ncbi:hypothetical protein GA0111570_102231 [Raineyella antarctica]|uniref:Uncharacterized protein n=1 Tax=Raineyella antarctica TaxID=1577474 RepID=A0A1G6GEL1_9ACTN|nr:hypothetical protein [Raineyella antarctica]SDB80441.1 hypothetical protein GA0111570_102231 [Raineyella antarctica]